MPNTPRPSTPWHAQTADAVATALATDVRRGLDEATVAQRLEEYGPNRLPDPERVTLLGVFIAQFKSPLIYVLIAAAVVAAALGDFVDAGFIMAVVLVNAALGTYQEWRAEQSAAALQALMQVQARVRRGGREITLDSAELVPGDVILLESGNRVPADARLVNVRTLASDESMLTGESMAADKQLDVVEAAAGVGDRLNMVFAGATITSGRGTAIVVATGVQTEVGVIARSVAETRVAKPPLVVRMEKLAQQISVLVLIAAVLVGGLAWYGGLGILDVFFLAVALAVSAIPEGLPVAMTVTLSIATARMAKRKVIVRRLTAVEGLGSCTCVASDKTGTLTVNRQTVRQIVLPDGVRFRVTGEGYVPEGQVLDAADVVAVAVDAPLLGGVLTATALCNEASLAQTDGTWEHSGDAVDVALLTAAHKAGLDPSALRAAHRVVHEVPFESERAWAATVVEHEGATHTMVKGALEALLPHCQQMRTAAGNVPVDAAALEALGEELSAGGHRFILVATGGAMEGDTLPPLTVLGLIGLIDPARPEAAESVQEVQRAGIRVVMITGDHPLTALAIARDVRIATERSEVVTGAELAAVSDHESAEYDALVDRGRVFARVTPADKLRIVAALQRLGHYVAVTGDGVNDAPALRRADIGVAMGSGTDVAKDTAVLIVTDDDFASIKAGVEEGRFAYDNIRKVTYLLLSTGAAEVFLLLAAILAGLPLPLVAVQLLWLNLVTNGIQHLALSFEAGEASAMRRPPRPPSEGVMDRQMIRQLLTASLTMAGVAMVFWWMLMQAGTPVESARNQLLLLFVLLENVHVFNCRSERASAFSVSLRRNPLLAIGVPAALGIHVAAMHIPFMQTVLGVSPIALSDWVLPIGLALVLLLVMELTKAVVWRRE
jgi:magnesium-transporting ATPase (P-type)